MSYGWLATVIHVFLVILLLHIALQVLKNSFAIIDISAHETWALQKIKQLPVWDLPVHLENVYVCIRLLVPSFPRISLESEPRDSELSSECADRSRPRNSVYSLQCKKLHGARSTAALKEKNNTWNSFEMLDLSIFISFFIGFFFKPSYSNHGSTLKMCVF